MKNHNSKLPVKLPIYMDYHSTTPVDPRVLETMMPTLTSEFGNAASHNHLFGWRAKKLVEHSRETIAEFIGAEPKEIIFTSGATESINIAIKGITENYGKKGNHIITQVTEHKAVLDSCKYLERKGFEVTYLPVDERGKISVEKLKEAITDKTLLVSLMFANNEIGTIQPIEEIGKITREKGVFFHVDAAQAAGKIDIDIDVLNADMLSVSSHKVYGPKGVGALYVRNKNPNVRIPSLIHGGGHERGMRSGTLNVPGIVGFGKACEIADREMSQEYGRIKMMRDRLEEGFKTQLDCVSVNGHPSDRLPNNLNISFAYCDSESLLMSINEEIAVSSGSACNSANPEISHVLKALGLKDDLAQTAIRFGLGRYTTPEEVSYVLHTIVDVVKRLRAVSPIYKELKNKQSKSA